MSKPRPTDLTPIELIKYLNGRTGWHGNQYRSLCGEWLRKNITKYTDHEPNRIYHQNQRIAGSPPIPGEA